MYNPMNNWEEEVISSFTKFQRHYQDQVELGLIIVNDGSLKDISEAVEKIKANISSLQYLSYEENKGKGHALKYGIKHSNAEALIYTDIDFPYSEASLKSVANALINKSADIVIGIRNQRYYSKIPSQRERISKILKSLNKKLFRLPTEDTQAGLKGMNQKVFKDFIDLKTDRYLIDLEFLKKARKHNYSFELIEIELRPHVELTKMHIKTLFNELGSFIRILFS